MSAGGQAEWAMICDPQRLHQPRNVRRSATALREGSSRFGQCERRRVHWLEFAGSAYQTPLAAHFFVTSQRKLAKSQDALYDTEERFNYCLALAVNVVSSFGSQLVLYLLVRHREPRKPRRFPATFQPTRVTLSTDADVRREVVPFTCFAVRLAITARVDQDFADVPERRREHRKAGYDRLERRPIRRPLADLYRYQQARVTVNCFLRVVCLNESVGGWHDSRVIIGQMYLRGLIHRAWWTDWFSAPRLFAGFAFAGRSFAHFQVALGLLAREPLLFANADTLPGLRNRLQAGVSARQLFWNVHPVRNLAHVGPLRQTQRALDLALDPTLQLRGVPVTECMMFGSVRLHFRSVDADAADLEHSTLGSDQGDLFEERLRLRQETASEVADRIVFRARAGCHKAKRDRIVRRPLRLARGECSSRTAVEKQRNRHLGLIGFAPTTGVLRPQRTHLELRHDLSNKACQMICGQSVLNVGKQQEHRISIKRSKVIAHGFKCNRRITRRKAYGLPANVIAEVMGRPARMQRMQREAKRAVSALSWSCVADQLWTAYESLDLTGSTSVAG